MLLPAVAVMVCGATEKVGWAARCVVKNTNSPRTRFVIGLFICSELGQ